jgi:aspartate carbamoyltransferase regulatory subunit
MTKSIPEEYIDYIDNVCGEIKEQMKKDKRIDYLFYCKCITKMNNLEHEFYVISKSITECKEKLQCYLSEHNYNWSITHCSPISDIHIGLIL